MASFSAYPALSVQGPTDIALQGQRLKNMRGASQLQEFQLGQAQGAAQRQGQLRGVMGAVGAEAGLGPNAQQALSLDPSMLGALSGLSKEDRAKAKETAGTLGGIALSVLTAPEVQRGAMWPQARAAAIRAGANPQNVPEIYDAGVEQKLKLWAGQAGQIKTWLDANPEHVKRIADAKRDPGGGLTVAQKRENAEIQQARKSLDQEGLSHEDVMRIAKSQRDTGRNNPQYSPFINSRVRQATRRKYGDDPEYAATYGRYLTPSPPEPAGPEAPPPDVSAEEPGILDRIGDFFSGGNDTPAPAPGGVARRGTPRAGGRFGPRGRGGAKAIPKMSLTEIDDLVAAKGDSLSPAEMKAVQARLTELGK